MSFHDLRYAQLLLSKQLLSGWESRRQEANIFFILMEVCPRALRGPRGLKAGFKLVRSDRVLHAPKWTATELMHDFAQAMWGPRWPEEELVAGWECSTCTSGGPRP